LKNTIFIQDIIFGMDEGIEILLKQILFYDSLNRFNRSFEIKNIDVAPFQFMVRLK
jgi:hypothetical protein